MKEYSYTSTPPMGRTVCTEPQCLYKGALYLYLYLYLCERVSRSGETELDVAFDVFHTRIACVCLENVAEIVLTQDYRGF